LDADPSDAVPLAGAMARPDNLSVGKYRFLVELGSGGMGDVFLAVAQGPKGFNKLQVIKRLRPELAEDPEFLGMFLNEARIAARLNHPNVVQTNEVSEHEDEYFIAMEYLDGQSLYGITKRAMAANKQRFPLAMHLHVLAEACEGLHYAHELMDFDGTPLELVHRDCSPQNVFVTYEGQVKVLDFGIAKAADSATFTRTGVLKGKVPYMSPEQLEGHRVDRRSDVFAVGAMLWEAATGTRLWKGFNDIQIANRLQLGEIPRPREFEPTIDPKLDMLVMKALARRPEDRFQSAAELHAAIDQYVGRLGGVRRRELGKYVSGIFTDTRRSLRLRLEEELREIVPSWRNLLSTGTGDVVNPASGEHGTLPPLADSLGHTPVSSPSLASRPRPLETATTTGTSTVSNVLPPPSALSAAGQPPARPLDLDSLTGSAPAVDALDTRHATALSVSPERRGGRSRALLLIAAFGVIALALALVVMRGRAVQGQGDEGPSAAAPPKKPEPLKAKPAVPSVSAVPDQELEAADSGKVEPSATTAPSVKKLPMDKTKPAVSTIAPASSSKPTLDKGDPWQ